MATSLNNPDGGPLYKGVQRALMEQLASGELKPGQLIPSERQLAIEFSVSIGTLRKAIDELVENRILIRQQGKGTYVASHDRERLLFYFFHIVPHKGIKSYPLVEFVFFHKSTADCPVPDVPIREDPVVHDHRKTVLPRQEGGDPCREFQGKHGEGCHVKVDRGAVQGGMPVGP